MGVRGYKPTQKEIYNISTTNNDVYLQLWQELQMLRYLRGGKAPYGKKVTAPYIDQAKTYFNDAVKSNWKSSGLIYYYSFLNLAKALIVSKRYLSGTYLASTNVYHGLSAQTQSINNLLDFEIEIHPKVSRGKKNIFAIFYKAVTGVEWPFNHNVKVTVGDIISYCQDIEHESTNFYGIDKKVLPVYSTIRYSNKEAWFEILCNDEYLNNLLNDLPFELYSLVHKKFVSRFDFSDWKSEYNVHSSQFSRNTLINFKPLSLNGSSLQVRIQEISREAQIALAGFFVYPSHQNLQENYWYFITKLDVGARRLVWRPILSNYLFAFVLSTILRYYPFLFYSDSQDSFISEAWCNQSPETTLRQLLMEFTNPSIRLN
ncbi:MULTISPECIES: YaaC family protein [Flagellimonas]|uniref:YaaC-like Protein n=1 Tax=Flagellimonas hadalis TaxID=2597517 RepID=A0A5N5ITN7_9FLAO|nr:YaaC family protein [Allomuricauda hadalis]KAB5490791.1 hypothetical protein FOT42_004990 [Allomuricauda hadalis]